MLTAPALPIAVALHVEDLNGVAAAAPGLG